MDLTNYKIQTVTLNTRDLATMQEFYQTTMGLALLESSPEMAKLGIQATGQVLLQLNKVALPHSRTSGLYHIAYLLPNRTALANFLRHIALTQYPLQGASDHGYSEAIYLADPEGNGIEVYVDKPEEQWDIREDGVIIGITEAMDVEGVLAMADREFDQLAAETIIGHVHLAVATVAETTQFFKDILAFTITSEFANQAAFYGKDGYHHQFAGNIWTSRHLPKNNEQAPGLHDILVTVSAAVMAETRRNLSAAAYPFELSEQDLVFHDPNGIKFRYRLI